MNQRIENQKITETIPVHGLLSGISIGTWQEDYPLTALDFEHIKNGKSITLNWANNIILTTIGYGISIASKAASQFIGTPQTISTTEWITILIGLLISFGLYIANMALPNNRKKVMKNIDDHFEKSPKKRQLLNGEIR